MEQSSVRCISISRLVIGMATLACGAIALPTTAAELRTGDDYIALIIEAEDNVSADERWVLTEPDTPAQSPDPDGNHSDEASGNAYLELLPDNKIDHVTPIPEGAPPWFWGPAGSGPKASYAVDFPEPGRYHVHVRAYTTGTEDNGIHIGLDDAWPSSGAALQICTASAKAWRWSSKKRGSGGADCGIRKTIYLDVDEAGEHTVRISAREDGFEIDRMMLIKDTSDNTRLCAPVFNQADNISCEDGGIESADDRVDLAVDIDSSVDETLIGERVDITATVENLDRFDRAYGTVLTLSLNTDEWRVVTVDEGCTEDDGEFSCTIGEMGPTGSEEGETFVFTLEALAVGTLTINATASTNQADDDADNDSARFDVLVDDPVMPTQLNVSLAGVPGMVDVGVPALVEISASNVGSEEALDTTLLLSLSSELAVGPLPEDCEPVSGGLRCELGMLSSGQSRDFSFSVSSDVVGGFSIGVTASAANADDRVAAGSLTVTEASDSDAGDTTDGGDTSSDGVADAGGGTGGGVDAGGSTSGDDGGSVGETGSDGDTTTVGVEVDGGAFGPLAGLGLLLIGMHRRRSACLRGESP